MLSSQSPWLDLWWRFETNLLRIDEDIDQSVQFWSKDRDVTPLFKLCWKINPTFCIFEADPLKIDQDIDEIMQIWLKHRAISPCFDRGEKLTPNGEDLKKYTFS